jgi:hypothetical protein
MPAADYGALVTKTYGVVPRPRSSVSPEAWARTKRPGKWRTYYGYRYRPESAVTAAGEARDKYSDLAIAAATIAHQERGGTIVQGEAPAKPEIKVSYMHGRKPEAVPGPKHVEHIIAWMNHEREVERERMARKMAPAAPAEARQCVEEPAAVPEAPVEPTRAPEAPSAPAEALVALVATTTHAEAVAVAQAALDAIVAAPACTCEADAPLELDRQAIAAAVLREMAAAYGPRRAHKLNAMADFVAAHKAA